VLGQEFAVVKLKISGMVLLSVNEVLCHSNRLFWIFELEYVLQARDILS